jgi:integrase/recombinase XerD
LQELRAQKRSEGTIKNELWVLNTLDKFNPLENITKTDLMTFFEHTEMPDTSLFLFAVIIKKYFHAIGKPELIDWLKKKKPRDTLHPDDILTTDDVNRLIDATDSHYYKALIAFLFETGCRISEARALKFKNFQDTDQGMLVNIPTSKTSAGYRKVILPFSSQYFRNLKLYSGASNDDTVFTIQVWQTNNMMRIIGKKAGIKKPLSAHKFRHAQATDLVRRGYNEAIIRKKLGWTPTSGMIARYQHLNDEDVINATIENTGKLPQTAAPQIEIKEAERLSLVDAAMQFSKLSEENETLKADMETMKAMFNEDVLKSMIEARVNELMKKGQT